MTKMVKTKRGHTHSHVALGPVVDRRRELVPQQGVVAHEPAGEEDSGDVVVLGVEVGQLRDVATHHVHQRLHNVRAPAVVSCRVVSCGVVSCRVVFPCVR